jgi:hypothetical protein
MRREVLLIGGDFAEMTAVSLRLGLSSYAPRLVEAPLPLHYVQQLPRAGIAAAILWLTGTENVLHYREAFIAHPLTSFVLLLPQLPPRPSLSRVAAANGAAILQRTESAAAIAGTLLALEFQRQSALS